jgi:hypothetical protein
MRKNGLRVKGCGFKISSVHYSPFSTRHSLSVTLPICRLYDLPISFGRANFLVSPIWVRGAECGCQAKIFGNAGALPHKTTRYSLFAIRYSPVAAIFGFNWRVVLPHNQKLDEFGCSGEQPSSFVPARPKFFRHGRSRALQKNHSLLATRRSPFAIVLALTGGSCSSTTEIFSARQSRALQKNHSLLATRYSLLAAVSARQEPRLPNSFRPSSPVPRPVLSWWLW